MTNLDDFIAHVARHHGIGHAREAPAFGLSSRAVREFWQRHAWPMPFPGTLMLPGTPDDFHHRVLAATRWVGGEVAATGVTALRLWGAFDRDPVRLQLVVPQARRNRRGRWGEVHRSDLAFDRPIEVVRGVPCVDPAWAVRDRAHYGGPGALRTHAIRVVQRRLCLPTDLEDAATLSPTARGIPDLLEVLEILRRDRVDSGQELDLRHLVRTAGFDPFPRPFPVRCPDGRIIHLDVAFPGCWFAYECDDPATHDARTFATDRTRWGQAQRAGWRIGFVWRDRLDSDPRGIIEELRAAHSAADPDRAPAVPAHECGDRCPTR